MKKQRYLVSDVAEITGLHPDTIRGWAKKGLINCSRDVNNWRVFGEEEVDRIKKMAGTSEKGTLNA